ncbi:NAD(P)-dependent alcohol dehydrogenase [Mycoplasmopsis pullorum]|uniref:NAD(P)-dependent alcohol dehydrogenase n=2 Tax=Mycoplasmopsis pullorum TaxID=48003 RepID=UPI001119637A|nr:NAD(P)-dependent alcohol dehydrogenase [Mycoplasmopsis pullorum]TNK82123.1 NAD(P)-dependent alcohol dehydrogenase [Mycoplasmopsis pullorum]TNK82561.1 NAD(P)-dependent alcohol dehydrogenase [Mycoplasmopsis pullorum]TNK84804.1 NAD(P)-dependent alcohol dehydrogenase [Mycoplasmopsis pullorum]TNK85486.1 NAD(P)-dependent alcohol dehydrogenase [Mycoplasmopsis pullorum]TNK85879.1 NAD(P)-dependent alcohol dehydrogenase [Mycoplasmopsis pullorum]
MKGYAMKRIGEAGWIEKDRPKCGPNDAILRPLAVAPCTSDIHTVYEGGIGERHDMILGHEFCGEVVEVGSEVKSFKPGDKVLVAAITPEWNSKEAQAGYSMHSGGMLAGWKFSNIKDGVFGEFVHVNDAEGNLAHMPEGMDYGVACMLSDMMPTGFHAAELADIQFGDVVAIFGIGPVGLMATAATNLKGAGRIIVVDSRELAFKVAKEYGATDIVDFKVAPSDEQIMKLTNNEGVDKVIIAGGDQSLFATAMKVLKPGGKIGNVNYLGTGEFIKIPRVEWGTGMAHKQIFGGLMPGGRLRLEKLARLITYGKIDPSKMITHRLEGFDKIEEAVRLMKEKPANLIKPVVIIEK